MKNKPARTVEALWSDFDPRAQSLDVRVVRAWEEDGIVFRYVTFHIGNFKGTPARMAAFYAFPKEAKKLPALLHMHGGGQRAFLAEVDFYARRGYACLSVNWGGREMEKARPGDPNTDWGAVDPTQQNVPGYFNLTPGKLYLDGFESARNNNWYLLTLGCRRGLTFLEQQPEVDAGKLGIYGHSMGGNLTVYVAGTDSRVKVAAPSVGGQGYRTYPWPLVPGQRRITPRGDLDLFRATLGFQSYAPHINAPLLWLGATNDFHGVMDDTYRTGALIPDQPVRYAFAPHLNHRFTPEFAVTRPLWMDQHLKGTFSFVDTPATNLILTPGEVPRLQVTPDESQPIDAVHIYYSIDPHPIARFWRSAAATRDGNVWHASLPILSAREPLYAFANVSYKLKKPAAVLAGRPTSTYAISSLFHSATPEELQTAQVKATDKSSPLIDDFSKGLQDWYELAPDNPHHWQYWTRKLSDPKWQGKPGDRLAVELSAEKKNDLTVVITENFFRSGRGKQQDFVAVVALKPGRQTVSLRPQDFKAVEDKGKTLASWDHADLLGFRAYYVSTGRRNATENWSGAQPVFHNLRWEKKEDSSPQ